MYYLFINAQPDVLAEFILLRTSALTEIAVSQSDSLAVHRRKPTALTIILTVVV